MTRSTPTLRRLLLVGAAATLTGLSIGQLVAHGSGPGRVVRNQSTNGGAAADPAMSADGRFVVYTGSASAGRELVTTAVWLRDRSEGTVVELTLPQAGVRDGNSGSPAISADGCYVAAVTEIGYDLFRDDDRKGRWDVYRLQLPHCGGQPGEWKLVSTSTFDGGASDNALPAERPAISGSGSVVAYVHSFSDAEPEIAAVTVVDLTIPLGEPGRSVLAQGTPSSEPNGVYRHRGIRHPSISDDGSVVTYTSDAQSSLPIAEWGEGPTPGGFARSQVFAWSREDLDRTTAVTSVSLGSTGTADGEAQRSVISGNGQYIAFESTSRNLVANAVLVPCLVGCPSQVYRFDRLTGTTLLVSQVPSPTAVAQTPEATVIAADAAAHSPAITNDGSEVAYVTRAANLFATRPVGAGGPDDGDIVVAQVDLGTAYRASVGFDGITPSPASSGRPAISAAGRVIAFHTFAGSFFSVGDNLSSSNGQRQVVAVDRTPSLDMVDLDVGSAAVGYPGPEWYVGVINRGPGSFMPAAVVSSNPQFVVTGGSCQTGLPVPPGGSCRVQITLSPTELGPLTGTLTVSEFGFNGISVESSLFGAGGDQVLEPSPAAADMGAFIVGESSQPMSFNLTNVGFAPTSVATISVRGDHPKDFKVTSSGCKGAALAIGKGCAVDVVFTPTGPGHRTATIVATSPEGHYATILVNGDARYAPVLAASTATAVAGTRVAVVGTGFAPNTPVVLMWSDGTGVRQELKADKNGSFLELVLLPAGERAGERRLIAQAASGEYAAVDIQVLRAPVRNAGAGNWPGK
jgi:Tol biopolymer transport system component